MSFRKFVFLVPVLALLSACGTSSKDRHTQVVVTPEARRVVEAEKQAAESGAQPADAAPTLASNDPDEVICRYEPPPTGSRLGKRRICATRSEWDALADSAREETRLLQSGGKTCTPTTMRPC